MKNEDKLKELLDSIINAPEDQLFISMSNGCGGLNMVAMNQDQSIIVDMMLRSVSAQAAFVRTPIELLIKNNHACCYCKEDVGMHLNNVYGNNCNVEIVGSRMLIDCIEDDHNRFNMNISFCPFCGKKLS